MDVVLGIFSQLGADNSLAYQFGIFVVLFLVSKPLFFDHLQAVIENREEKTVGLENSAGEKLDAVSKLSQEYKEKILAAKKSAKEKSDIERSVISKDLEANYRKNEKDINAYVEDERKKALEEFSNKKTEVLAEVNQLSQQLISKITQE